MSVGIIKKFRVKAQKMSPEVKNKTQWGKGNSLLQLYKSSCDWFGWALYKS